MNKPENPYKENTISGRLYNEDWSDKTKRQIADILHTNEKYISNCMSEIKSETGYCVPYIRLNNGCRGQRNEQDVHSLPVYVKKAQETETRRKTEIRRSCDTCGNIECSQSGHAVCWTKCKNWIPHS